MVKDSTGRCSRSYIHGSFMRVRRTVFGTTAAASERELPRGFSVEGVKGSVQLPP